MSAAGNGYVESPLIDISELVSYTELTAALDVLFIKAALSMVSMYNVTCSSLKKNIFIWLPNQCHVHCEPRAAVCP